VEATLEQPGRLPEVLPLLAAGDGAGRYEAAITAQVSGLNSLRV